MSLENQRRIRFRFFPLVGDHRIELLRDVEFRAFWNILRFYAGCLADNPSEFVGIAGSDKTLSQICVLDRRQWKKIKAAVLRLFIVEDGCLRPVDESWIEITQGTRRPVVGASTRMAVMRRDDWTCVYCGSQEGPFDVDHIIPVSRQGSNTDLENLVCACARCNNDKSACTPEEWMIRVGSRRIT